MHSLSPSMKNRIEVLENRVPINTAKKCKEMSEIHENEPERAAEIGEITTTDRSSTANPITAIHLRFFEGL